MDHLWLLHVCHCSSQPWAKLLCFFVESAAVLSHKLAISFVVVHQTTPITKYRHMLILERDLVRFANTHIHIAPSAERLIDLDVNPNSKVASTAFPNRPGIDLFYFAYSAPYSVSICSIHPTKGKVVDLYPKGSSIKTCIVH